MDLFNQNDLFDTEEPLKTVFDLPGADITFYDYFFTKSESNKLFESLLKKINWQQDNLKIYGKLIKLPRLTAWYGDTNKPSSNNNLNPWNEELLFIKKRLEKEINVEFPRCLLNLYRDGNDSVDWHQDYDGKTRENTTIASVTFGESRPFQLKHVNRKDLKRVDIPLSHGSLLLMKGATQLNWKHKIPKTTKQIHPRINLTFRHINQGTY